MRRFIGLLLLLTLTGCSAIETYQSNRDGTAAAQTANAATVERTLAAAAAGQADAAATARALSALVTQQAATRRAGIHDSGS